jgi:hypothetical protein
MMKLMDTVRAYLAADELSRQTLPYDLALAVVRVKRQTREDTDFFLERERALVQQYAALDESGHVRLTPAGTFVFRDPKESAAYEQARRELGSAETGLDPLPVRVKAPAEIKPAHIEALEGFISFAAEDEA